jgi:hypothetical protein
MVAGLAAVCRKGLRVEQLRELKEERERKSKSKSNPSFSLTFLTPFRCFWKTHYR